MSDRKKQNVGFFLFCFVLFCFIPFAMLLDLSIQMRSGSIVSSGYGSSVTEGNEEIVSIFHVLMSF